MALGNFQNRVFRGWSNPTTKKLRLTRSKKTRRAIPGEPTTLTVPAERCSQRKKKKTPKLAAKDWNQPMPWVTWPRFFLPETAGILFRVFIFARVRKLTARIARLKRWESLSAVKPLYTATAQSHCACCACRMKEP